jgi:hypothetical protein
MMGPVDISGVLGGTKRLRYFSGPSTITELNSFMSGNLPGDAGAAMLTMPETTTAFCSYPHTKCMECKSDYGATLACAAPGCTARLHPLCAWYAGFYVSCSVDPSCALLYNENPAERGLSISLYCQSHAPPEVLAQGRSTVGQRQLRCKYRGGEMDASSVSVFCVASSPVCSF